MLITRGNAMMGTVYDDINKMATQLNVGDCLTFGSFVPVFVAYECYHRKV